MSALPTMHPLECIIARKIFKPYFECLIFLEGIAFSRNALSFFVMHSGVFGVKLHHIRHQPKPKLGALRFLT